VGSSRVAVALIGFVTAMTAPVELLYAIHHGIGAVLVTVFAVSASLGLTVVDALSTRLIPRIDARHAVVLGTGLFAVSEFGYASSGSAAPLIGSRLVQGAAFAVIAGGAMQLSVRLDVPSHRAVGSIQGMQLLGGVVGAPVGGFVATLEPGLAGERIAFLVCGASGVMVTVLVSLVLPPVPPAGTTSPQLSFPNLQIPAGVRSVLALGLVGNYLHGGVETTAFPLVAAAQHLSSSDVGIALALLSVVEIEVMSSSGSIFQRWNAARVMAVSLVLGVVAVVVLATTTSLVQLLCAAGLFGAVDGIALVAPPVLMVAMNPDAGHAVATYRLVCGMGSMLGSSAVNATIDLLGPAGGVLGVGVVLAVGALLAHATRSAGVHGEVAQYDVAQ